MNLGVLLAMVMTVPITALFLAIPEPITSVFYEHGKFGHEQVCATAPTLAAFAIGLPAYMLAKVFATVLFANSNTRYPCIAGLLSVITCTMTIPLWIPILQQSGIALAVSSAAWVNVATLYILLRRYKTFSVLASTWKACFLLVLAGVAMGGSLYGLHHEVFGPEIAGGFFYTIGLGCGGGLLFWGAGRLLGSFTFMHTLMRQEQVANPSARGT
jgi:putative peptidoglycan lipid II flippase